MEYQVLPIIASLVYFIMFLYKQVFTSEKAKQFIPLVAGICGAGLGAVMFFNSPELILSTTIYDSILIGAVSGLSAVGINQVFKQYTKNDN